MSGFNLEQVTTFERDVKFCIPLGKAWRQLTLTCEFKLVSDTHLGGGAPRKNRELLEDVLIGVRGIAKADGSDASAEDGKEQVIKHDVASAAVARAYVDAINEGVERKN